MTDDDALDPATGARFRAAREEQGLSMRLIGARVGISPAALSHFENGKSMLRRERLADLAAALGIDLPAPGPVTVDVVGFDDWRVYEPLELDPVLTASIKLFVELGYHGTSVRLIAERCGFSTAAIYHYYPSKQAILTSLLDLGMVELLARTSAARADGVDPLDRFSLLVESIVLYHVHRQDLAFIGATELRGLAAAERARQVELRDEQQRMVDDELAAAMSAGLVDLSDAGTTGRAVVTMCTAVVDWYRPDGPATPAELAQEYVGLARRLAGA
ncbi:MAG: TetR family transcriptional regulator [Aeromicrobium sp.]